MTKQTKLPPPPSADNDMTITSKKIVASQNLAYVPKAIVSLLTSVSKGQTTLADLYIKFWNPVNYAIIGVVGAIINYLVWAVSASVINVWWAVNFIAILCAWIWTWANSVGPLGYLWGFKKQNVEKRSKT